MNPSNAITDEFIRDTIKRGRLYVLAFYRMVEGAPKLSRQESERLQTQHLKFLIGLRVAGKIVLNGPLMDDGNLRGIAIIDLADVGEAVAMLAEDPAVKAGRLVLECRPWFGLPGDALPR